MIETNTKDPSEKELIELILEGNTDLFEVLLETHLPRIYGLALRMTGNPADAEDVLQEASLLAFSKLKTFRGESSFGTWLFRITLNSVYMTFRRNKREPKEGIGNHDEYLPRFDSTGQLEGWPRRLNLDPEDQAIQQEAAKIIEDAISNLPTDLRAALIVRDIEDLSTREAAAALELSEAAVKSRLHRARLVLRRRLELRFGRREGLRSWLDVISGLRRKKHY